MGDSLTDNYLAGGFGGDLGSGTSPGLLIVDFVQAYTTEGSPLFAGDLSPTIERCRALLDAVREAGRPVFHTGVSYRPDSDDGGLFRKKLPILDVFLEGSPLGRFVPELEPGPGETVIMKHYASSFFGTPLAERLREAGVDTLYITGVTTSGCIRATALDALQNGFAPMVVRDAVGDRHPDPHEANLFDLQAKYADLVTADEAIATFRALTA